MINTFHFLAKGNQMLSDDLNGLNVGDLIYNEHRKEMFIIGLFKFERPNANVEDSPYILGHRVTIGASKVEVDQEPVTVSIHGSHCVTGKEVNEMILKTLTDNNNRVKVLQELANMCGE